MRTENLESKVLSTGKITNILFPSMLRCPFSLCFKCLIKLNWNKCPHKYWCKFKHLGFKSHPRLRCNLNKASVSALLQTCQISWAEHEIHTFLQHHHLLCSQHNSLSPHRAGHSATGMNTRDGPTECQRGSGFLPWLRAYLLHSPTLKSTGELSPSQQVLLTAQAPLWMISASYLSTH